MKIKNIFTKNSNKIKPCIIRIKPIKPVLNERNISQKQKQPRKKNAYR